MKKTPTITAQTISTEEYQALVRSRWSEAQFTRAVIALAQRLGWKVLHVRPARTARGWRTPVQGDGRGFLDLFLVHRGQGRCAVAELKVGRNRLTPSQTAWREDLHACGLETYVWYPRDWATIEKVLA